MEKHGRRQAADKWFEDVAVTRAAGWPCLLTTAPWTGLRPHLAAPSVTLSRWGLRVLTASPPGGSSGGNLEGA